VKRNFLAVFATSAALITSIPLAHAETHYIPTRIYLDGNDATNPAHTTAIDPSSGQLTSYMPIYYAEAVLTKLGITSTWDGTTWSLTAPANITPNLDNPSTGVSQMDITINGTLVQTAPKMVAVDPSSGKNTTFIPIWYLGQVLNRLSVTSTWDGTNWRLTRVVPETQTAMAQSMWTVFDATSWDVVAHPTMAAAGVNPTSGPVTADDVATWLADWAGQAKGYKDVPYNGNTSTPKTFVPYSLKYESSADPYTWANENDLYQGMNVTSSSSVITTSDVNQLTSNLQWWLTGDRVVNGVHHLDVPMYGNYDSWNNEVQNGVITEGQFQLALADGEHYYDETTATVDGSILNLTLPDTSHSASQIAWNVTNGSFVYGYTGGSARTGDTGGITLHIPLNTGGFGIVENAFTANLMGWHIYFLNENGSPVFKPYDGGNGQQ